MLANVILSTRKPNPSGAAEPIFHMVEGFAKQSASCDVRKSPKYVEFLRVVD